MKNKVIEGQIDMFDLLSYKEMKLRCIKQFSVPKRYFEFRFNTGSIYETYGKNGKTYVQHELIGIEYENIKIILKWWRLGTVSKKLQKVINWC